MSEDVELYYGFYIRQEHNGVIIACGLIDPWREKNVEFKTSVIILGGMETEDGRG